ncbi:MAG: 2'-5' RNA ligase family protein [Candidatus Poribacteria bacterium]|nr:2'-5' RNA ligase family protein [Candidatus Poribacteria bacterium]
MPSKTHTTAVVLIPPETVQSPIQAIRQIHDRNFQRWMPHITLLYPFAARRDFAEIMPALTGVAQQVPPFSIELARFDAFQHRKSCTMFLVPEPATEIVKLHNILLQHLPDYDDTARFAGGFHPHLSVGQFQHRVLQTQQQRLQTEWQPIRCEVDAISLIYRSPETDDRFVVAAQFPFQTRSQ